MSQIQEIVQRSLDCKYGRRERGAGTMLTLYRPVTLIELDSRQPVDAGDDDKGWIWESRLGGEHYFFCWAASAFFASAVTLCISMSDGRGMVWNLTSGLLFTHDFGRTLLGLLLLGTAKLVLGFLSSIRGMIQIFEVQIRRDMLG